MIHRREWFSEYRPRNDGSTVSLGDDGECTVAGEGTVLIQRLVHGEWKAGHIENVPGMRKNLLSVGVWDRKGYKVVFKQEEVRIYCDDELLTVGILQSNNIYLMFIRVSQHANLTANVSMTDLKYWHEKLGHVHVRALKKLVDLKLVSGVKLDDKNGFFCELCQIGKAQGCSSTRTRNAEVPYLFL